MSKSKKSDLTTDKNINAITQEGYDKLVAELEERKTVVRNDIANKLELATEQGDLSENAAYKGALEEKEFNEKRIEDLEDLIANSQVIDDSQNTTHIGLGNKVKLRRSDKVEFSYSLVGKSEANPLEGQISIESPIGKAIYGKSKGQTVQVVLPKKTDEYTVVDIS